MSKASLVVIVNVPAVGVLPVTCVLIIKLELAEFSVAIFFLGKGEYKLELNRFLIDASLTLNTPVVDPDPIISPSHTPATSATSTNVICDPSPTSVTLLNTGSVKLPAA